MPATRTHVSCLYHSPLFLCLHLNLYPTPSLPVRATQRICPRLTLITSNAPRLPVPSLPSLPAVAFQLTACISSSILHAPSSENGRYIRSVELWEAHHEQCAGTIANAVMLALPFWWRLMQCLKVSSTGRVVISFTNDDRDDILSNRGDHLLAIHDAKNNDVIEEGV